MVLTIRVLLTIVTLLFYYVIRSSVVLRNKYFRHDIFCVATNKYIMYKVQDYDYLPAFFTTTLPIQLYMYVRVEMLFTWGKYMTASFR